MNPTDARDELMTNNDGATEVSPRRKRRKLTQEQQDLAARHVPLARALSRPLKDAWPLEREEIDSSAFMALVEAAKSFDPNRGVKFGTFARIRIVGALRDTVRGFYAQKHVREMPNARTYRYVPGMEERGLLFMTSPDAPVSEYVNAVEEVEHWFRSLPKRHALACREVYLHDRTLVQIGAILGCSKSRISCLHAEALEILRDSGAVQAAALESGLDVSRN